MAESLPFGDATFDTVCFLTSLDHILDYPTAVEEALRVLKKGGVFILATLVWLTDAALANDNIHMVHFRPAQVEALLEGLTVVEARSYPYGDDHHRYGAFVVARKDGIRA